MTILSSEFSLSIFTQRTIYDKVNGILSNI